jgi:hypothetical protein
VHLHFFAAGMEARLRYPMHLKHAEEIDEKVSQAVSKVVSGLAASNAHS